MGLEGNMSPLKPTSPRGSLLWRHPGGLRQSTIEDVQQLGDLSLGVLLRLPQATDLELRQIYPRTTAKWRGLQRVSPLASRVVAIVPVENPTKRHQADLIPPDSVGISPSGRTIGSSGIECFVDSP